MRSASPPAAVAGGSAAAFPSAASVASAGAAFSSSVHLPVAAALGAGTATTTAPEEMVSTVHAAPALGWLQNLPVCWIFLTHNKFSHVEKSLCGI